MIESGDWGYCVVTGGKHEGAIVYYDDDASEKIAICYPEAFAKGYIMIPRALLRPANDIEVAAHKRAGRDVAKAY